MHRVHCHILQVAACFSMPLDELVNGKKEAIYANQRSRTQWEMLLKRVEAENISSPKIIPDISAIAKIKHYTMPTFPSIFENEPIWGMTAIMTDKLLHHIFRDDGYAKHKFLSNENK